MQSLIWPQSPPSASGWTIYAVTQFITPIIPHKGANYNHLIPNNILIKMGHYFMLKHNDLLSKRLLKQCSHIFFATTLAKLKVVLAHQTCQYQSPHPPHLGVGVGVGVSPYKYCNTVVASSLNTQGRKEVKVYILKWQPSWSPSYSFHLFWALQMH